MPGLKLYHSNRMEVLADRLAEILAAPLVEPFAPEIVLVQSRGMERWLSMALADRHGVCTNVRFPYPTHFVHALFQAVDPALPARSPYEPAVMTWDLVDLLSALPDRPEFQPLTAYLGDDGNGLKRYQLASRIAALFDQYLLFRPEWMPAWERGQETHWQAALWREIVRRKGPVHRVALRRRLLATIGDATVPLPGALERIAMFGISSLPPFYMQILAALAARIEVNLFIVNPCREFWEDIVSEREAGRIAERLAGYDRRPEAYHLEAGNRLLASLGPLGREFLQTIAELSAEEFPEFVDPGDATLLAAIQSHILNLKERTSAGGAGPFADDGSLRVHVCHSPLRETEILHDALLGDRLAEGHALLHAGAHLGQRPLGHADEPHAVVDTARAQTSLSDGESGPALTEERILGHPHVLEVDHCVATLVTVIEAENRRGPHQRHAGSAERHEDETVPLALRRIGVRDAHDERNPAVGPPGRRRPPLAPVEDPLVAVVLDGQVDVAGIRAGHGRLRHREARAELAGQERLEPPILLLGCPIPRQDLHVAGVRR